jgi:DNA invertase Pin-like site-specific DNA recombinase
MARSVRHLTEIAAHLAERGMDLVVLKQGIDTTTPAGRFTFHVLAAMDEMLADLISEGTREGLESARARGRAGGRKPKLTARQAEAVRGMYEDKGADDKHEYTVAETAEVLRRVRKTIYRHLEPSGDRRQPGKTTPLLRDARHEHPPPPVGNTAAAALPRQPATRS